VAQLLWAAQGVTHGDARRTAPSAGALYPLEIYLAAGDVEGLPAGLYHYEPVAHALEKLSSGDLRVALHEAALSQDAVGQAAAILVIAAVFERTKVKYGERGERYVHAEVGAVAQNVALQVVPLELGTVYVGAFQDEAVRAALNMPEAAAPLCLLPLGRI
jgi:SagB-type dehydrogenase family enzyme